MKKVAVILFNLGGPDQLGAVKPFLYNLFSDPAIIRLPVPLRQLLAKIIASKRAKTARNIYAKIGGRSPIFKNTQKQARALEKVLADIGEVKCFIAMRYWHPFTAGAVKAVKDFSPDEIILLPLYPQFSTTTTGSSLSAWWKAARKLKFKGAIKAICCYPEQTGFIQVMTYAARACYHEAKTYGMPRLLFSAHGLPEKIIKAGDPYQFQCERTASSLARELDIEKLDWVLCYQSRVGPLAWIGPTTEAEIERAGCDRVPVIVVPISFVSEHSETLHEIDILYRDLAVRAGVPYFTRVSTAGTAPEFIAGLAGLVRMALTSERNCFTSSGKKICPPQFCGCCNQSK